MFGYDASLVIARDPSRNGVPLPDGSADPDVVPALVIAFSVDKPSHRPGHVAVEALQQIDDSLPRGYLAGDRAYNDQKPENFQLTHANRRKLRAWADSIALLDDRPRRRPTRHRRTKPLGTWTPKGYVTKP